MKSVFLFIQFILFSSVSLATYVSAEDYAYPYKNPYYASVTNRFLVQPPKDLEKIKSYTLNLFDERSKVLYYGENAKLEFYHLKQKSNPNAPVTFIVAGTGGSANSTTNLLLGRYFYSLGHQVIFLASPVSSNFIVAANSSAVSGLTQLDAAYLHHIMKMSLQKLGKDKSSISEYNIAGYSLGALEAAFVAKLDDEKEKFFNFRRVLLVNPPYRLQVSARIIDDLFAEAVKLGAEGREKLTKKTYFTIFKLENNPPDEEFLLKKTPLPFVFSTTELKALIGISFKETLSHMFLTAELISSLGVVHLGPEEKYMSSALSKASRYSFIDYFKLVAVPHWSKVTGRNENFEKTVEQNSLHGIQSYLHKQTKIRLIHSADDIIMAPGEVDELERIFKTRSIIFPAGGHVGNLWFPKTYEYLNLVLK